jgi:RNA polymerase sigma-70 factor (ECF subfamily)
MVHAGTADADLAERIRQGDPAAEAELYRRHGAGVKQILVRITGGDFALADELCQDALIVALKRLRKEPLDDPRQLPAFVAQVARNLAIAERRKQGRRQTSTGSDELEAVIDEAPGQEGAVEVEGMATAVRTVLRELKSARDRALLIRYYLRDEDKASICRDLGLAESVFNVVLFRARNRLRELLQKRGIGRSDFFVLAMI